MLNNPFFDNWNVWNPSWVMLSPDTGAGGGGGEGGDDDGDDGDEDEPKYTEADLQKKIDTAVKRRLQKASRDAKIAAKTLEDKDQELTDLKTQLDELREALQKAEGTTDEKSQGRIEMLQKQYDRDMKQVRSELETERKARESAEAARKQGDRERALDEALQSSGCRDMKAGRRYFSPQIKWDDFEAKWMFETDGGNTVEIDQGVSEEMPDYLKPPSMNGGAGSQSGSPKAAAKRSELEKAQKDLKAAITAAQSNHMDNASLARVNQLRRTVKQLEAEIG